MKTLNYKVPKVPSANIAVNKSRLKVYKNNDTPTYYLEKGQEFQIELFNPTTDTVLAKITLNNKLISQGGLVLNPGQRVFLDRYLDVAKKFMFDTYEVSNSEEVKEAIANNGDIKVQFYREMAPVQRNPILSMPITRDVWGGPNYNQGIIRYDSTNTGGYVNNTNTNDLNIPLGSSFTTTSMSNNVGGTFDSTLTTNAFYSSSVDFHDGSATMDWMQPELSIELPQKNLTRSVAKKSKTIETGRVEEGSKSDQKFKTVSKDFEYFAFHTVEYKLLPVSQKINTSEDLNVRRYCTNCGAKQHKDHKFCGHCGTKA
jgi:hypothetical protein